MSFMSGVPRSQRLMAVHTTTSPTGFAWTCPDGYVTLVKAVGFGNTGSATGKVVVQLRTPAAAVIVTVFSQDLAPNTSANWQGFHCLNPGDTLFLSLEAANLNGWASGAVLSGPPQFPAIAQELPLGEPDR